MACQRSLLASGSTCRIEQCACGTLHVTLGPLTLRLEPEAAADVAETLRAGLRSLAPPGAAHPPPHDPAEREVAHAVDGWEVRVFTGSKFAYFAPRGLWHVQLWHPRACVSVLTPSRLTAEAYEIFPSAGWKRRCATHEEVARVLAAEHGVAFLDARALREVERVFVEAPASRPSTTELS